MIRVFLVLLLMAGSAIAQTRVQGLSAPVEIVTDSLGIPHVTAQSIPDAFFGQGYAAASQRAWQMEITRRRNLGRLAVAFGAAFVPFDIASRTMLFEGDLDAEWARLDPRVKPIALAFVAGVNARLAEYRADPTTLPPEFAAMEVVPEDWSAEDFLRARFLAANNVTAEFRRARLACLGLLDADRLTAKLEPERTLAVPAGLDPCGFDAGDLALYNRLSAPLPWPQAVRHAGIELPPEERAQGSNAWVISPRLSATGRAILANDPHLGFSVPGPRFITHLKAPGLDAIGAGPASRPGFQFGHTDRIAFGRTDFRTDQEDLYLLELNADGSAYRARDGWHPITRRTETIEVRGGEAVSAVVATCDLGPLIAERPGRAVALRSAFLLPGPPVALEYVLIPLATDWASYRHAVSNAVWGSNYMYADIEGNIGWQTGGRVPRRRRHDGLLPVPGHGDYPWDGLIGIDELPGEFNPARGWIASANQMPFPADYPFDERRVGFEHVTDDRYRRIAEVLSGQSVHSLADSVALQHDTFSMRAAALRPLLARIGTADLRDAVALLQGWDGRVDGGSHAAAVYEFWSAELQTELGRALIGKAMTGLVTSIHPHVARDLLLAPDASLGADPVAARDRMLEVALRRAVSLVAGRDWASIHTVSLRNALSARMPGLAADVSGLGGGGDGTTVMARWWAGVANTNTSGGAMFAAVIDVGDWDASVGINAPGQSGDPRDAHYADGYRPWLEGRYRSLPFGDARVAAMAEARKLLVPSNTP